ncbi:MAG: hypothetical protein IPP40_14980 [bacterium]|nr:hypothetical protein [bacterium]
MPQGGRGWKIWSYDVTDGDTPMLCGIHEIFVSQMGAIYYSGAGASHPVTE